MGSDCQHCRELGYMKGLASKDNKIIYAFIILAILQKHGCLIAY
jgi:hypothetical protein